MKTIRLNIIKSTIIDTIKSETFIKGLVDKATDDRASMIAYQEAAGDDAFHERKLERIINQSAERLSTLLGDWLSNEVSNKSGDNSVIIDTSDAARIVFDLKVTDRFNESYTTTLARLSSQYIENQSLVLWWTPINDKQAALYDSLLKSTIDDIQRCFNKVAPKAPVYPFTKHLSVDKSEIEIVVPKDTHYPFNDDEITAEIRYTIDENAIDDINYETSSNLPILRGRSQVLHVYPRFTGTYYVDLYSCHMEEETKLTVTINVRYEE